jgi:uncharacterized repeat protein (TIGR03803 family)
MRNKGLSRRFIFRMSLGTARIAFTLAMVFLTLVVAAWPAQGQTYTVVHTFGGSDGANPVAGLILDGSSSLYGTTFGGGAFTFGTVFKIDESGSETVLHSFYVSDGAFSGQPVIRDASGNLYGVALDGTGGAGVVFKLNASGKETVLYRFIGGLFNQKPKVPETGLLMDKAGNLYGTTISGGVSSCSAHGNPYCGTVFKLAKNGKLTILHSFTGGSDGAAPYGGLIMDQAGNLYGTTYVGGDLNCTLQGEQGCGVVFKLDTSGKETVLHTFTGKADGAFPIGGGNGLIEDAAGNLYGTAAYAGGFGGGCAVYGCGTVFEVDKNGTFTVLYTFKGKLDGAQPNAGLIRDPAGNLYGTTQGGVPDSMYGSIFKLDKRGVLTVLHALNGGTDGANPFGGLVRDAAGTLYGTTYQGFTFFNRVGTVFKVTP